MSRFPLSRAALPMRPAPLCFVLLALFAIASSPPSARANIVPVGDVSPVNPSTWTGSTMGYVGNTGSGTLTVDGGSDLLSGAASIGASSTGSGSVSVSGSGSTWSSGRLYVGKSGSGTLSITSGGSVSSSDPNGAGDGGSIAESPGSTGSVVVSGTGSTWSSKGPLSVGVSGHGSLLITNGGRVSSTANSGNTDGGMIAVNAASTGVVTVEGAGSTWTTDQSFFVGYQGGGTLSVVDRGSIHSSGGFLGMNSTATGLVTVQGTGSQWASDNLIWIGYVGAGRLSITGGGSVTSTAGYLGNASGSSGVVTVDGAGSTWTDSSDLYVGYTAASKSGSGTLSIVNGGAVAVSRTTYVAHPATSTGAIDFGDTGGGTLTTNGLYAAASNLKGSGTINTKGLVSDLNLKFDASAVCSTMFGTAGTATVDVSAASGNGDLGVGYTSAATLTIKNGAVVYSGNGYLGYKSGSQGMAVMDGTGSTWTMSNNLYVGNSGSGTLTITGGGAVTASSVSVNGTSLLAIDVGRGSLLTVAGGTGSIANNNTIRVLAGAGVATGSTTYSPIVARYWNGSGAYQAVGGTWLASSHTFTASNVTSGISGSALPLNLASVQRALIDDAGTGWEVGASFVASTVTKNITFTATAMNKTILDALRVELATNESVLSGWSFGTTNYTLSSSNPVYLSFKVGAGISTDQLDLWHYDGSSWTKFSPFDLTYDGKYASFTASSFSGYAMAVPEPGTLMLLAAGFVGLVACSWRRRGRIST
jgi:T5SS/PEP-CTERM-associated repeat protein